MYDIKLINPLRQFGYVEWTLVCEDPDELLPSIRADKQYPETVDAETVCANVVETLSSALSEEQIAALTGTTIEVHDVGGVRYLWQI